MSQMIKLEITQACYEGLRCSVCSGYLSLAPIRLLPDGSALCCHCVPPNNAVPYRAVILENVLSKATFPCRYKQCGCTANVQFNKVLNHEDECMHRPFPCATLPHTSCTWKGSASQVTDHFVEQHSNFIQNEAKIKLRIDQNKEGVLLVKANPGSFLVKYGFISSTCSLSYQIRLCMVGVDDQNCKLQLSNDFDPDYNVNLKVSCIAYNTDLCNDSWLDVDVKSLLAVLNNPENVTVLFHIKLPTPMTDSSPNNEVDYKLLDSNRCGRCRCFLVPPVFDSEKKIICGDCSTKYAGKPTANKSLENLLITQNFPCKWRGCNFIGNGDVIRRHQTECNFRLYVCSVTSCQKTFKRSCAELHMKEHGYFYLSDEYVDTFNILTKSHPTNLFAIIDYEIIVITTRLLMPAYYDQQYKIYKLIISGINPASKLVGSVYFSHQHCKLQSKFSFSSNISIPLSEFPACFNVDCLISATIKIEK